MKEAMYSKHRLLLGPIWSSFMVWIVPAQAQAHATAATAAAKFFGLVGPAVPIAQKLGMGLMVILCIRAVMNLAKAIQPQKGSEK